MKFTLSIIFTIISAILFGITPSELLVKMEKAGNYDTSKLTATMKIVKANGDERVMEIESMEKRDDEDKSIMIFTAPARLKNTKILTVGDNIWYYNKRSNRVKLLSQNAKQGSMMGSGFSYDDMNMEYKKKFTATIDKEDEEFYYITMTPKEDKKYKFLKAKVRKQDFISVYIHYYDNSDSKYKTMTMENFKEIDGRTTALTMLVEEIADGKKTFFIIHENSVRYNLELKESIFSERNLKK